MAESKKENWIKTRHKVTRAVFSSGVRRFSERKYNAKITRFDGKDQYLILFNHQTPFDQFFVGTAFDFPVYFVATEDIFSNGFTSRLLEYFLAPVPIKKGTLDIGSIRKCLQIVKEGGSIAIAPEGNRTYSGKTGSITPAISTLAKKLGMPVLLFRIEGGYGAEPRWSDEVRKGPVRAYVSELIDREELKAMDKDELFKKISDGLYVDEANSDALFESDKRAEYIERMVYTCPFCGFAEWESSGNEAVCRSCGRRISYGADKKITGIGFDFSFSYAADWYEYQEDYVNRTDVTKDTETPYFTDQLDIYNVELYKNKKLAYPNVIAKLYGDRVELIPESGNREIIVLDFDTVSGAAVLGRNKLNMYYDGRVYQFKGNKRFNALKYMNIYYRYKNLKSDNPDEKYLGM